MKLLLIIDKFHSLLHSEYSHTNLDISTLIHFHCCVCVIIQFSWFLHLSIRKFVFLNFSHPFRFSYNCNFRAAAFAPSTTRRAVARSSVDMYDASKMVGVSAPLGFFDPLGFSKKADEATMMRYREAELKHGRVAMIAVLGYLSSENWHPFYDGKLSDNPLQALWDMPPAGAVQIIAFIGLLEYTFDAVAKESGNPVGDFYGISNRISDKDAPAWVDFQTRELNNGRLAMFGIMGELAHSAINGQGAIAGTMSTDGHYGLWYLSAASGNQY